MKKKLITSLLLTTTVLASATTVFADTTYTVKKGDTLTKIAKAYNMSYKQLAEVNGITNPNYIYVGDVLTIPTKETTEVEPQTQRTNPVTGEVKTTTTTDTKVVEVTPSVDTISSASTGVYYQDGTWSEEKFVEIFRDGVSKHAAVSIATVNADGTPNAATIVPSFVNEESNDYLKISVGSIGNTVQNLKERKYAVITAYQHNPEAEDKFVRNNGIRVVVETVTDQDLIDKFNVGNKYPDNTVYMKIVKFLPLG